MTFYKRLSKHYDELFPLTDSVKDLVNSLLLDKELNILDIGCATGTLFEYIENNHNYKDRLFGLDLSSDLLKIAKKRTRSKVKLIKEDIMNIDYVYENIYFDIVFCLGNTLVHLKNENEIELFFKKIFKLLKQNGIFVFQIINYDYIFQNEKIKNLPDIITDSITFKRNYKLHENKKNIIFTGKIINNIDKSITISNTTLYPVNKDDLNKMLSKMGFSSVKFYNNFQLEKYNNESLILLAIISK